jgi:hypothetical protein
MTDWNDLKIEKLAEIKKYRKKASYNRALLSYKYAFLKLRMNIIQVLVIVLSTMITFLEALRSHYDFNENIFNVVTISMSTLIAFIMAIYRFFRIEENKENMKQSLEEHVFIINKFRKIHHVISNFRLDDDAKNLDEWKQIILTYDSEIFENYITIKEKFDVLFSFQDSIYYKSKYKRNLLELEFTDREIELVDAYKREKHEEFITRVTSWCKRLCCCLKREQVEYGDFIRKAEEGHFDKKEEDKNSVFDIDRGKVKTNTTNANGSTNAINFKVTEEQSL